MIGFGKGEMQVDAMYSRYNEFNNYFRIQERGDILNTN